MLNEFRESFIQRHPEQKDLHINVYARFLTGYKFEMEECTRRIETFSKWSLDRRIYSKKPEDFPRIHNKQLMKLYGTSRGGCAVLAIFLKNLFFKENSIDDISDYISCFCIQSLDKCADPKIDKYIIIVDIKDTGSANFDKEGLRHLIPIFSNSLPDALYRMYIVNVGFVASTIYSMVSVWLHEVTRKKTQVLKENNKTIREALLEDMDMSVVPEEYKV